MPAALADASQEQIRQLKKDPRKYMGSFWRHPARQTDNYDFHGPRGEEKLHYLVDDRGPLNPYQWGSINVLLWARGCLKTTTLLGVSSWALQFFPGVETYMTAPREGQVTEFVDKLKETIEQTGLDAYRTKDSYGHQKFRYEDESGVPMYSHFKTDTGWGEGDALRGPHSHIGIIDEFQDISRRSFQVFSECIDQVIPGVPFFPAIFVIGTPKLENSFFHEMWSYSDQREWDPERQAWVAHDEAKVWGDDGEQLVRGWRIDQPRNPLFSDGEIERKRETKSEMAFRNEVLAQFYAPEDELLAERHVERIRDDELSFRSVREGRRYDESYVTMGVDWGGGEDRKAADTVMVVAEHFADEGGQTYTELLNVDFLDDDYSKDQEFEKIEKAINGYDADKVVVDEGYGSKRREDLQDGNHTLVDEGYHHGRRDNRLVGCRFGNISDTNTVKWKDSDEKKLFTADKTHAAKSMVDDLKSGSMTLPSAGLTFGPPNETGTKISDQLTAPYEERVETPSGAKKTRVRSNRNDDVFDALVYAWLAYYEDKVGPTRTFATFGGHDRPGH